MSIDPTTEIHVDAYNKFNKAVEEKNSSFGVPSGLVHICDCCQQVKSHILVITFAKHITLVHCTECITELNQYFLKEHASILQEFSIILIRIGNQEKELTLDSNELNELFSQYYSKLKTLYELVDEFIKNKRKFSPIPEMD